MSRETRRLTSMVDWWRTLIAILDPVDERKVVNNLKWNRYVKKLYRGDSDNATLGLHATPNDEPVLGLEKEEDTMMGPFLSKTREKLSKAFLDVVDPKPAKKQQQKADDTDITDYTGDDNQSIMTHISVVIQQDVSPPEEPNSRFSACFG